MKNYLRISAMTIGLAAATSAFALAASGPTLTPIGVKTTAKLQPTGGAMMGSGLAKRHSLLAGVSSKKSHAQGWMASNGPKVVNVKKG
jgi:hypothetical protein